MKSKKLPKVDANGEPYSSNDVKINTETKELPKVEANGQPKTEVVLKVVSCGEAFSSKDPEIEMKTKVTPNLEANGKPSSSKDVKINRRSKKLPKVEANGKPSSSKDVKIDMKAKPLPKVEANGKPSSTNDVKIDMKTNELPKQDADGEPSTTDAVAKGNKDEQPGDVPGLFEAHRELTPEEEEEAKSRENLVCKILGYVVIFGIIIGSYVMTAQLRTKMEGERRDYYQEIGSLAYSYSRLKASYRDLKQDFDRHVAEWRRAQEEDTDNDDNYGHGNFYAQFGRERRSALEDDSNEKSERIENLKDSLDITNDVIINMIPEFPSWYAGSDNMLYRISSERTDFNTAKERCEEFGGNLLAAGLRITNRIREIKMALLTDFVTIWLGRSCVDNECKWEDDASGTPSSVTLKGATKNTRKCWYVSAITYEQDVGRAAVSCYENFRYICEKKFP